MRKFLNQTKFTLNSVRENLSIDFEYHPVIYSAVYASILITGFTTGILIGKLIRR